jgi:hypothetical protein
MNGTVVAYEEDIFEAEEDVRLLVVVRDLRDGKLLHKLPTGTVEPPQPSMIGVGSVTGMVIKSDGSAAWIAAEQKGGYQVHTVDKTASHLVASGGDIDPSSLALAGSTLYWTQGGKPVSASLR